MSIKRATVFMKMREAVAKGQSRTSFYREMRAEGLAYRKSTMFSDYRGLANIEEKKDLLSYVRKDRLPSPKVIAIQPWAMSNEYMYVCKVKSRVSPDEPIVEKNINIMQDKLLTPAEIERLGWEMISEQSPKLIAQVVSITPWTAVRRGQ